MPFPLESPCTAKRFVYISTAAFRVPQTGLRKEAREVDVGCLWPLWCLPSWIMHSGPYLYLVSSSSVEGEGKETHPLPLSWFSKENNLGHNYQTKSILIQTSHIRRRNYIGFPRWFLERESVKKQRAPLNQLSHLTCTLFGRAFSLRICLFF